MTTLLSTEDNRWLKAQSLPVAVVFNAHINGLGVVRSLGRWGVPVAVLAPKRDLATESRYCRWLCSPDYKSPHFLDFLKEIGMSLLKPGCLFPLLDFLIDDCIVHKNELNHYYHLPIPSPESHRALADKRQLLVTASQSGILTPPTWTGGDLLEDFTFPALLKPLKKVDEFKSQFGVGRIQIDDWEGLVQSHQRLKEYQPLVQSVIPGGEENLWTYGAAFIQGVPLAEYTGCKLLQYPPGAGTCAVAESRWNPSVADLGRRLLMEANYTGLAQVEFKAASKGRLYLLEVNPRAWAWNSLATDSGVNLSLSMYAGMLGKKIPDSQIPESPRWRHDRLWLLSVFRLALQRKRWRQAFASGFGAKGVLSHGDHRMLRTYAPMFLQTIIGEVALFLRSGH